MFIISTLAHKFQCHFVHSPSSKIVVAIVEINMLVLGHGRGFFCLHVQRLHHIWQCWCCSVGSDLQKWRSTFSWCQYIKPLEFPPSKRRPWLQGTVACSWWLKNQGIRGLQSRPILRECFIVFDQKKETSYHSRGSLAAERV